MNLIERYIDEVGKNLPNKIRADIQTEIRSTLEDMLEDRAQAAGRPVDDDMIKDVIREYGAPDRVAAAYLPERYLIGPRFYPMFILIIKIVFSVLTVLELVKLGIRLETSALPTGAFISMLGSELLEYLSGLIATFGNIVFIFAILQWSLPASESKVGKEKRAWDPSILEKEPEPAEINIWTPIWTITMTIIALLIFNVYPQVIGISTFSDGKWSFAPFLSEAFFHYLPWIDALWLLQIALNMILLRQGRWTTLTRWFKIALTILAIVTAFVLLKDPTIIALSPATLTIVFHDSETANTLANMFRVMPFGILTIIVIAEGINLLKGIYRLARPKSVIQIIK
jgi:hypothetical protein